MRYLVALGPIFLCAGLAASGQQNADSVHSQETEITAPVLLPSTPTISTLKHCDELDGVVKFAATINTLGLTQELRVLDSSDYRLTGFATKLVEGQRFKPGIISSSPAPIAVELTVGLHTCAQREKHPVDDNFYQFTLRAHPQIALAVVATPTKKEMAPAEPTAVVVTDHTGGKISPPIPTVTADPEVPVSGKLVHHGLCLIGVTVDTNGVPQNIRVVRSLDPELDSNAVEAVKHWRFKAALRDGKVPIPVEGTIAAIFGRVDKQAVAVALFISKPPEKVNADVAHHDKEQMAIEPVNSNEVFARYWPQNRIGGRCLVSLLIDTNGVPQNVHVVKGLDSSLDMETVAMIEHLRFKPVLQDGTTPVAVGLVLPVRYRTPIEKLSWGDLIRSGMGFAILFL